VLKWSNTLRRLPLAMALFLAVNASAYADTVAITFDDLPMYGRYATAAEAAQMTTKLLAGLKRSHWRATGFVNEIQLEGADRPARIALLTQWLDSGMDLGNHSYSHLSLTSTPVDVYIADVARGETVTRALLAARGRSERWFRYPYLETGPTLAIRRTFEAWLSDHGYRVAPVTMENSDWEFAEPYDDALAHNDQTEAAHIRQAYLDFTARILPWYREAAHELLGREPAFVFLLHASRLNADSIEALAAIVRKQRLHVVTLDRAMTDPAYRIEDDYAGPDGDENVTRWSFTLHKTLPYDTLPQMPADIEALDAKLDPSAFATLAKP
jgi:peptidoglycan/xylan/chitin deacetylase (PgdA/CDA1 family)